MSKLEDLAIKYNSDKHYRHSYIPVYEKLLANRKVMGLLEIGIGYKHLMEPFVPNYTHGSSIRMWREYLPDAGIYACDVDESTLINEPENCIWSMKCDQGKPGELWKMVREFGRTFDVIIDDGSHVLEHQLLTAAVLLPYLRPGGVYVIEDVMSPNESELIEKLGLGWSERHMKGGIWDDCLVVIER